MPSENSTWLLWLDSAHSPYFNMAADELLLPLSNSLQSIILRFYSWDRPSASFGFSQSPSAILRNGLSIVRRPTGGGAVYHDSDLTYTLAIPHSSHIAELDRMQSYKVVHEAVLLAIKSLGNVAPALAPDGIERHDRATLQCFRSPSPYDVLASAGSKLAGAAQRRARIGILHQGSISLDAANGDRQALASSLISSFSSSFNASFNSFIPSQSFLESAHSLANLKYASDAWNLHKQEPAPQS